MNSKAASRGHTSRAPLRDATDHALNTPTRHGQKSGYPQHAEANPLRAHPMATNAPRQRPSTNHSGRVPAKHSTAQASPPTSRVPSEARDADDGEKRFSQVSTSSATSSGKRKTHIGPWQLGRTLGKGSAGRVRLARHHMTQQQVAVKILPKHGQNMTQAGSLADIDKWDRKQPEFTIEKRMPLSIEREVAILKLIDHPNIMKLYDIWENRSEIYLVLEFVEQGDLFEYINRLGALPEMDTIYFFRQIISALDYCHSFGICHRDLKPENILLTSSGQVKIADFGMAAIQQSPHHRLKTACGSPHYAAPELVERKKQGYVGATVDIWSIGVILYACLCACLPFDDRDMTKLLMKAKRGVYDEPKKLSVGSKDLLRKMLTPDPERRITISQIWKHPLIVHYDYLDDLSGKRHDDNLNGIRKHGKSTRLAPEDIDMQTLRQLKSMYHMFTEKELALKLINDEPNDQKLFYWLLFNYREKSLENYVGELTYSSSDYHHLRPANWTKKFTTLEFPARYGRTPSRFTVISTVATENGADTATDGGTIQSYDPYKSSRIMGDGEASHAKITVHRNGSMLRSSTRATLPNGTSIRTSSTYSRRGGRPRHMVVPGGMRSSRRSLASIRSTGSTPYKRPASRRKRGVDFSRSGRQPAGHRHDHLRKGPASIAGDDSTYDRDHTSPTRGERASKRVQETAYDETQSMVDLSTSRQAPIWHDELHQFSDSIAKDCDEAFNSSHAAPDSYLGDTTFEPSTIDSSVVDFSHDAKSVSVSVTTPAPSGPLATDSNRGSRLWDARPLPLAPPPSDSVLGEIMMAKRQTAQRRGKADESPDHVDRMMQHLDNLASGHASGSEDRRSTSAPIYSQYSTQWGKDAIPLPSIHEGQHELSMVEGDERRVVSAPTGDTPIAQSTPNFRAERNGLDFLARQENTIRMVTSPSNRRSPVRAPAPLNVRKKPSGGLTAFPPVRQQGANLRQQYAYEETSKVITEEPYGLLDDIHPVPVRKKSSWFKRTSNDKLDATDSVEGSSSTRTKDIPPTRSEDSLDASITRVKKKNFSFAFWRNSKEQNPMKLSLADVDFDDCPSPEPVRMFSHPARPVHNESWRNDVATRNIEPQQSWLARLFRVKPAKGHLCFTISRRRARQEIAILLKEWRRYGIRDVQVDKDRNIVFGRVGPKNYLNMREVSFAAEIMTVIEHGKRNPLSIVRFTQERGAASSFHKVVDTMHAVFSVRNLLVTDKHKEKMMIKTLNSQ